MDSPRKHRNEECWNDGIVEYWDEETGGSTCSKTHHSIIPPFHYSMKQTKFHCGT